MAAVSGVSEGCSYALVRDYGYGVGEGLRRQAEVISLQAPWVAVSSLWAFGAGI